MNIVLPTSFRPGKKKLTIISLFLFMIVSTWVAYKFGWMDFIWLRSLVQNNPNMSIPLFVLTYISLMVLMGPTLPLNFAAGIFWGPWLGGALSALSGTVGSIIAFSFGRTMIGQPLARKFDHKFLDWAQNELKEQDWKFIAFLRLNPIIPTGPLNYTLGLTSADFKTYTWATALFLFPPSVLIAYIGNETGNFIIQDFTSISFLNQIKTISACIVLLMGMRFMAKYLRRRPAYNENNHTGTDAE